MTHGLALRAPARDVGIDLRGDQGRGLGVARTVEAADHGGAPVRGPDRVDGRRLEIAARSRRGLVARRGDRERASDERHGQAHRPPRPPRAPRGFERGGEGRDIGKPRCGIDREPTHDRRSEPGRDRAAGGRGTGGHRGVQGLGRVSGERTTAVQDLVQRHAQRELIRARIRGPAPQLLGRHICRRARELRDRRVGCDVAAAERPGAARIREAEVCDTHAPVVADQQVARLDVAMDQRGGVGCRQAPRRGAKHLEDLLGAARHGGPRGDRLAAHELHREEHATRGLADVVDRHDVRVRELRERTCLAEQPVAMRTTEQVLGQELQRDLAIERRVVRRVHHAHRPGADLLQQGVSLVREPRRDRRSAATCHRRCEILGPRVQPGQHTSGGCAAPRLSDGGPRTGSPRRSARCTSRPAVARSRRHRCCLRRA